MNYLSTIKKTVGSAALIAIGILLPLCFHGIPNAGSIFSPMHIPVLIAGFLFGPLFGVGVGLLTPLLNSLITGMPPPYPVLPPMMVECALYGAVSGLLFRLIKTKWMYLELYVSLVVAMLVGRLGGAFTNYLVYIGRGDAYSWSIFVSSYFVTGWPAIQEPPHEPGRPLSLPEEGTGKPRLDPGRPLRPLGRKVGRKRTPSS